MHPSNLDRSGPSTPSIGGYASRDRLPCVAASSSAQTLSRWTAALQGKPLGDRAAVRAFLKNVVQGHAGDARVAKEVFNDLIAHEAYSVFVDVFKAHQVLLQQNARPDGEPFISTLSLQLPAHWEPQARDAMHKAFAQIQVQRLEVVAHSAGQPYDARIISIELCAGIATLLKAGATALAVSGLLGDAFVVAEAIAGNPAFDSLEFGHPDRRGCAPAEAEGYGVLMKRGAPRGRLKHLTIHRWEFVNYVVQAIGATMRWPALTSLNLRGCSSSSAYGVQALVRMGVQSPHLTKVSLSFEDSSADTQMSSIFRALKPSNSLTHLDIQSAGFAHDSLLCLLACPLAVDFWCSCPTLTHFAWDSGTVYHDAGHTMESLRLLGPPHNMNEPPDFLKEAVKKPIARLKSVSMTNFPMTRGAQDVLFGLFEHNRSIEKLNLSGCCISIESTQKFTKALSSNTTLQQCVLPHDPALYCLTAADNTIHAFRSMQSKLLRSIEGPVEFELVRGFFTSDPPALDAATKLHAETLHAQIYRHTSKRLLPHAFPPLAGNVAQFMETAASTYVQQGKLDKGAVAAGSGAFDDVASLIAAHLETEGALRSAVRLNEALAPAGPFGERTPPPGVTKAAVKALVKLNNAMAVAADMPTATSSLNEVNANGANIWLLRLVELGKPFMVSQAISTGVIDFGGQAAKTAPSGRLRNAFLPVNTPDETGANKLLMMCVRKGDADGVLRARAMGAIDFDGRARNLARARQDTRLMAAFLKVAVLPKPTTSVTTTNTTAITTTTAATQATVPQIRTTADPDA